MCSATHTIGIDFQKRPDCCPNGSSLFASFEKANVSSMYDNCSLLQVPVPSYRFIGGTASVTASM